MAEPRLDLIERLLKEADGEVTAKPVKTEAKTEGPRLELIEQLLRETEADTRQAPAVPIKTTMPSYIAEDPRKYIRAYQRAESKDIYGGYSPEKDTAAVERAQRIATAPRTVSKEFAAVTGESLIGETGPTLQSIGIDPKKKPEDLTLAEWTTLYSVIPPEQRRGVTGIAAGLLPQALMDREQKEAYDKYIKENPSLVNTISSWAQYLTTYQDPQTGRLVENTPAYLLRLLSVPVSALAGALETPVREVGRQIQEARGIDTYKPEDVIKRKPIDAAIAERVAKGEGVMGPGIEAGSQIAFETGGVAVSPVLGAINLASKAVGAPILDDEGLRAVGATIGGFSGLAADFALPIVPGTGVASRAAGLSKTARAAKAERLLDATRADLKPQIADDAAKIVQEIEFSTATGTNIDEILDNNFASMATRAEKGADVPLLGYEDEFRTFIKSRFTEKATDVTLGFDPKQRTFVPKGLSAEEVDTFVDQFATIAAKNQIAGKAGVWKILTTPEEKLIRTGVIGFLPEKAMPAFNKKLSRVLNAFQDVISKSPDEEDIVNVILDTGLFKKKEADDILQVIKDRSVFDADLNVSISNQGYNEVIAFITEKLAQKESGYTTIFDLQNRFEKVRARIQSLEPEKKRTFIQKVADIPRVLTKEMPETLPLQAQLVAINESVFMPKEVDSMLGRAFKTFRPQILGVEASPLVKQFAEELGGEWANLNELLRRQYTDELRSTKNRVVAFENTFLAQPNVDDVDKFTKEYIAMILGRVETLEEVLSSEGINAAEAAFKFAEAKAGNIIKSDEIVEILARVNQKGRFELTDANEILAAVKAIVQKEDLKNINIRIDSKDLLQILTYNKMYKLQQEALIRSFEKVADLAPALFPFKLAQKVSEEITEAVARATVGMALSGKDIKILTSAALESALSGSISIVPSREVLDVLIRNRMSEEAFQQITVELLNNKTINALKNAIGPDNQQQAIKLAAELLDKNDMTPLLGETLTAMARVNPVAAELFAVLKVSANLEGASEVVKALRQSTPQILYKGASNRLVRFVGDVFDNVLANRYVSFMKGSLLAGRFLPNLRFFTMNQMTAPFIIYSTLGAKYGLSSLRELVFANPRVEKLLATMSAPEYISPKAYGILDVNLKEVAVRTPSRVYTYEDLRDIIEKTPLMRSQARAEVTRDIIKEFVERTRLVMRDAGPGMEKFLGLPYTAQGTRALKRFVFDNQNIWGEMANTADNRFRLGVLIRALEDGASEQNAIKLARESLFDYNQLTAFEKKYVNNIIWFWTFEKSALSNTLRNFFENPARLKNVYLTKKYFDYDRENSPATKEYAETRLGRMIFEDKELLQRYSLNGPSVPLLEGVYKLADAMGFFLLFLDPKVRNSWDMPTLAVKNLADYAAGRTNPLIASALILTLGVDPRSPAEDKKPTGYVDPKLMSVFESFGLFDVAASTFFEAVPLKDEVPGRQTFNGRQWRVREGQKENYSQMLNMLTLIGIQRTARDYAPLVQMLVQTQLSPEDKREFITMRDQEVISPTVGGSLLQRLGSASGISTPIEEPSLALTRELAKRTAGRELQEITRGKKD
jgi:hypothetical protein